MTDKVLPVDVSRETSERLTHYAALLEKWNPRINLVAKSTLADAWTRHIVDSLQILELAPQGWTHWMDMGSGGGFPGLVIAIAAQDHGPDCRVTLIESDQRKCAFLRTVIRETGAPATVLARRIEDVPPLGADVVSARALADLDRLLGFFVRHAAEGAVGLFPKGANWKKELTEAQLRWDFSCARYTSKTEEKAVILRIQGVARV